LRRHVEAHLVLWRRRLGDLVLVVVLEPALECGDRPAVARAAQRVVILELAVPHIDDGARLHTRRSREPSAWIDRSIATEREPSVRTSAAAVKLLDGARTQWLPRWTGTMTLSKSVMRV
jgi:hypothetical protein